MDLTEYRNRPSEQSRIGDLLNLLPDEGGSALDVGARDGYISALLTRSFQTVTALDLIKPDIKHDQIRCVGGDVTALEFPDDSFDLVLCTEVLEHLPRDRVRKACSELSRVTKSYLLVGVPYKQDIRVGRTTCSRCRKINPPWGHINAFDEDRLRLLFPDLVEKKSSYVGENDASTNSISAFLLDVAGNPYGTYADGEVCGHCGAKLETPPPRNLVQKIITKCAYYLDNVNKALCVPQVHANWIHILFLKNHAAMPRSSGSPS